MSLLDWFKSGPQAAEKVLDAGIRGLDALVLTEEERIKLRAEMGQNWLELQKVLGQETSVRSITRRVIAFLVVFPYVGLLLLAAGFFPFMPDYSRFLLDLADSKFGWLVVTVAGFYFGPHMLGRILGKDK